MHISDLDFQILTALAEGRQSKEIAALVQRSRPTVETHIRLLYAHFSAKSRAHLVALAIASNVIAAPPLRRSSYHRTGGSA